MKKIYLPIINSTNSWAKEHILEIEDCSVVYTFNQTAGRGRLNRVWNNSGIDNIYASIILKPSDKMLEVYNNLTQYLCVVLAKIFEEYGVKAEIKWPNDIKIKGKKISGILAEAVCSNEKLEGIILGVGVNLNSSCKTLSKVNQAATSLNIELGHKIDKDIFLDRLLDSFILSYDNFIKQGFSLIRDEYKQRATFLNREISLKVFDKVFCGYAIDITEEGALKIADENGVEKIFLMGDIL